MTEVALPTGARERVHGPERLLRLSTPGWPRGGPVGTAPSEVWSPDQLGPVGACQRCKTTSNPSPDLLNQNLLRTGSTRALWTFKGENPNLTKPTSVSRGPRGLGLEAPGGGPGRTSVSCRCSFSSVDTPDTEASCAAALTRFHESELVAAPS